MFAYRLFVIGVQSFTSMRWKKYLPVACAGGGDEEGKLVGGLLFVEIDEGVAFLLTQCPKYITVRFLCILCVGNPSLAEYPCTIANKIWPRVNLSDHIAT